jgi:hypothetical protein
MELHVKYQAGFLKDFDKRTELYQLLTTSYNEVVTDLGGADILSRVQLSLVERYVFFEFTVRALKIRIVNYPRC